VFLLVADNICNICGITYIPYGDGQGGQRDVASCFICYGCYYTAACEMEGIKNKGEEKMITCDDCIYWGEPVKGTTGRACRRFPPVSMIIRGEIRVVQPRTEGKVECGEGRSKSIKREGE